MFEKDEKPDHDPETIIQAWKQGAPAGSSQIANPAGELEEGELDHVVGGQEAVTLIISCPYSYEDRISCGHVCTLTLECGCSTE